MRIRDIERAIKAVNKAVIKLDKMNKTYPKMYKDELEEIGRTVISQWYATYDPIYYNRQMSLKDTWKVSLRGTEYRVDFAPGLMKKHHDVANDYIYENSFIQGYHGGADSGDGHPHPGIPYWRTPFPQFHSWGRPALRSFSPYNRMMFLMKKKIKEIDLMKQDEFDAVVNRVNNAIQRVIS